MSVKKRVHQTKQICCQSKPRAVWCLIPIFELPINLTNICGCFLFAYVIFLFVWHNDDSICKIGFPALMICNNVIVSQCWLGFWGGFSGEGVTWRIYLYFVITFICWFTTKSHVVYAITKVISKNHIVLFFPSLKHFRM
jgi:hypothetical protein